MDKLCPLAVFFLFFIPSAFFYRFCKKSVFPRWRYALVLLPGSQGAVRAAEGAARGGPGAAGLLLYLNTGADGDLCRPAA